MNKLSSSLAQLIIRLVYSCILLSLVVSSQAAVTAIQNPKLANMHDGFLELKPNGTLILRSTHNSATNIWQDALIFKAILNAIRLLQPQTKDTLNDLNQTIYGDGVEHKFPPFLERVIQRIQTYFSIYRYTDTSQPVLGEEFKSTSTPTTTRTAAMKTTASPETTSLTTSGIAKVTLTLGQENEIDTKLSNGSYYDFHRKPLETNNTSTTTEKSTVTNNVTEGEENEFIEIKERKLLKNKKS